MFTLYQFRERESILKKISKIGAIRCQILRLKCTKFDFPLAELTVLPTPCSWKQLKGNNGDGEEGKGREWKKE